MSAERCWELLSRKISGEATGAELEELRCLQREMPELNFAEELLCSIRQVKGSLQPDETALLAKIVREPAALEEDKALPAPRRGNMLPLLRKWGWAAALTGVVLLAAMWSWRGWQDGKRRNEIVTRYGSRTSIVLPDGSSVRLNAGSRLVYEDGFGKKNRVVQLEGEAFFDVKEDPHHPFIVNTPKLSVKVLGTAFNVSTYAGDRASEAVLMRGKIEVRLNDQAESRIILKPLEKLTVADNDGASVKRGPGHGAPATLRYQVSSITRNEEIDDFSETAWLNNRLAFKDETLASLARRMERWYNAHIVIKDTLLANEEVTGVFQNETVTQALDALRVVTSFTYTQRGDSIFIQP